MTATLDASTMVEDRSLWPTIAALTACLCRQIVDDGLPVVCICSPMPGEIIATDYVTEDAGMAWVRMESGYPSTAFPAPSGIAACDAPLAFGLELGIAYCAPMPDDEGNPPSMNEQFDATRLQLAGMNTIRRAILCCFPSKARDVVLGTYQPLGPEGGVVGGFWSISVAEGAI
jgi:hypothetical protein